MTTTTTTTTTTKRNPAVRTSGHLDIWTSPLHPAVAAMRHSFSLRGACAQSGCHCGAPYHARGSMNVVVVGGL
jgi:hypothetical protein